MMKISWNLYYCSLFLLIGGAGGFVAISYKVLAPSQMDLALVTAISSTTAMAVVLTAIWLAQYISARYILLAKTSSMLTISFFMISMGSPLFFLAPPSSWQGASIIALISTITAANTFLSYSHYRSTLQKRRKEIDKTIKSNVIDIEQFSKIFSDYPPTIATKLPTKVAAPIAIGGIFSMLIGLNLFKVYPTLSVIAWSVPTLLVPAFLLPTLTQTLIQLPFLARIENALKQKLVANSPTNTP